MGALNARTNLDRVNYRGQNYYFVVAVYSPCGRTSFSSCTRYIKGQIDIDTIRAVAEGFTKSENCSYAYVTFFIL